jgi:putative iron-regulated protein
MTSDKTDKSLNEDRYLAMGLRPIQLFSRHFSVSALALLFISGCGNSSAPSAIAPPSTSQAVATNIKFDPQILSDFTDKVVIPNNNLFAERAKALSQAIDGMVKSPNSETLKASQNAWIEARAAWEQTECFGFGPADSLGYDGSLDTWPINETDFKAMLKSGKPMTAESVSQMKETEKGFHVIEYLLFGNDKSRKPTDLGQRDLKYLQLLGADFAKVASDLATSWSKGIEGKPAYREVLATAGVSNNKTYPTLQAGAEEMVQGMLDSLDEVANEKMGKTFEEKAPKLAESRFSFNTLTDMKSNLQGSQNVYLGSFPDANTSGKSLSAFVAQAKPELDGKVKEEFKAAMEAMNQIPAPFEKAILDPKAADSIKAAQSAINAVRETIEKQVKPLVVQS